AEGGKEVRRMNLVRNARSVALSRDGKLLAVGMNDGEVKLWEFENFRDRGAIKAHQDLVMSVAFSPDGKTLATASTDGTTKLWDVAGATKAPGVVKAK